MRRITGVAAVAALLVAAVVGFSIDEPKDKKPKPPNVMQKKLVHSQKILEGIAIGNHKLVEENAEELLLISKQADFKKFGTPLYEVHSNQFRRSAETLIENAKAKNTDAAALTYVEMTLTCVKCHKYVRESRMTLRD